MRGPRTHQGGELRRATSMCDMKATTARAGRAILSVLIHCRFFEKVRRRGRMTEGCQTTVVGVGDRSLMMLGYLQDRRQK